MCGVSRRHGSLRGYRREAYSISSYGVKSKLLSEKDKIIRTRYELPIYLNDVMIGLLLSDGS